MKDAPQRPIDDPARQRLYREALRLFQSTSYEETSLEAIAAAADTSLDELLLHFPSKKAIAIALYEELSARFAKELHLPGDAGWAHRVLLSIQTSLDIMSPHRRIFQAVLPAMMSSEGAGLLSVEAAPSRALVRNGYIRAIAEARGTPSHAEALGRLSYLLQLGVLLWWLLDRSPNQRATAGLMHILKRFSIAVGPLLWIPGVMSALEQLDALAEEALYAE